MIECWCLLGWNESMKLIVFLFSLRWVMGGGTANGSAKKRKQKKNNWWIDEWRQRFVSELNEDKAKVNLLMEWKNWMKSINERCLCFGGMKGTVHQGGNPAAASPSTHSSSLLPPERDEELEWSWMECLCGSSKIFLLWVMRAGPSSTAHHSFQRKT